MELQKDTMTEADDGLRKDLSSMARFCYNKFTGTRPEQTDKYHTGRHEVEMKG